MAWLTRDSRVVYHNNWISVREDAVTGPGGDGIYGVVTMQNPAVFVVALDANERVALVRLERYTTGSSLEIPAGGTDGEDPLVAARRELEEETGFRAEDWTPLGTTTALNGIAVAPEHTFLARTLHPVSAGAGPSAAQAEEGIESVSWVPFADVLARIRDGRITDGETIAAIALAGIHLGRFR